MRDKNGKTLKVDNDNICDINLLVQHVLGVYNICRAPKVHHAKFATF